MMEFNYLFEQNAIANQGGRYTVDYTRMPRAITQIARELLTMEATGDRARAEAWFKKYDQMPEALTTALKRVTGVPVDVDPVFSFPEVVN